MCCQELAIPVWIPPDSTTKIIDSQEETPDCTMRIMLLSDCARRIKAAVDIDSIGFTEEELEKADYFDIGALIQEKGVVVYKVAAAKRSLCRV